MNEARKVPLLIVDDDGAIRKLLSRIAERAGFDVDTAKDGVDALEMLQRKDYMIAIVDLMMPRLSGYELVQRISTLEPRPFVIVATALTNGDVASLDDSMVRRVIRKPFDVQAVGTALVEIARQIAETRAEDPSSPAELIMIAGEDLSRVSDEAPPPGKAPKRPPEDVDR